MGARGRLKKRAGLGSGIGRGAVERGGIVHDLRVHDVEDVPDLEIEVLVGVKSPKPIAEVGLEEGNAEIPTGSHHGKESKVVWGDEAACCEGSNLNIYVESYPASPIRLTNTAKENEVIAPGVVRAKAGGGEKALQVGLGDAGREKGEASGLETKTGQEAEAKVDEGWAVVKGKHSGGSRYRPLEGGDSAIAESKFSQLEAQTLVENNLIEVAVKQQVALGRGLITYVCAEFCILVEWVLLGCAGFILWLFFEQACFAPVFIHFGLEFFLELIV
ncbi:hypothetical protein Dimus_033123 [Dionaea muscipula]